MINGILKIGKKVGETCLSLALTKVWGLEWKVLGKPGQSPTSFSEHGC